MTFFNPQQISFVAGRLSPRLEARDDLEQYFVSLRQCVNYIPLPHGGLQRRSGTRYIDEVKDSSKEVALIPFLFSTEQAYICEFGDLYVRFYTNEGLLVDGSPVEVVSPYLESEVAEVQYAQEADVMYLVHPNHPPYKLQRTSATTFTLTKEVFRKGHAPLRAANLDDTLTVTVTGAGPSYTLTWSSDIGLDSGADVGRAVRITNGSSNNWYLITAVTSGSVATATLEDGSGTPSAEDNWALGTFSDTEGCGAVELHEGRLAYGGYPTAVDRFHLSVSDDFNNFDLIDTSLTDAENDDRSIARRTVSRQVNRIRWMASANEELVIGTSGGEFRVQPANGDFLTPTTTSVKPASRRGSAEVLPVVIDDKVIYIQRNQRKVRRFEFALNSDAFVSRDVSILAEDISSPGGITRMSYQQDPDSIVWMTRGDGTLLGMTVENEQEVIGFHTHRVGGKFKSTQNGIVESIATIPTPDLTEDTLWMVVKREIDGSTVRYVELLEKPFNPQLDERSTVADRIRALDDAKFSDSSLSLDVPLDIEDISSADPGVITITGHGLANDTTVKPRDIKGDLDSDGNDTLAELLNNRSFVVKNVTANTFTLETLEGDPVDTTGVTAYIEGGNVREEVMSVTGLAHLEGQTVQILLDGDVHPDAVVSSGQIDLVRKGSIVRVGLVYRSFGETQRFVGGGRTRGTDAGQIRRVQRATFRLLNTVGGLYGTGENQDNPDELEAPTFRRADDDTMDDTPGARSGDIEVPLGGEHTHDPTVYFEQDQPLPQTILAIWPSIDVNERD